VGGGGGRIEENRVREDGGAFSLSVDEDDWVERLDRVC